MPGPGVSCPGWPAFFPGVAYTPSGGGVWGSRVNSVGVRIGAQHAAANNARPTKVNNPGGKSSENEWLFCARVLSGVRGMRWQVGIAAVW